MWRVPRVFISPPIPPDEFEAFIFKSQNNPSLNQNTSRNDKLTLIKPECDGNETDSQPTIDQNEKVLDKALDHTQKLYSISSREMDVFKLIVNGLNNKEIANELFISEHTVKNHITHIFQKMTVNDRLQAMAKLYQTVIEEGKSASK